MRSENPFRRAFWTGTTDPRPLAIFRIALGVTLLHDLADFDVRSFLTDDGMLPRAAAHAHAWYARGVFDLAGSYPAVAAIYALGVIAVLAFTVGFHTRAATIASWVFLVSLHHRNLYVVDGADDLARVLLMWGMIADFGARYSVDAWRAHVVPREVPALGLRLLQAQVALLYGLTAILKVRGGWLSGDAVFRTLQLDGYQRPLGAWMLGHPHLCDIASRAIPVMELAIPILAFSPIFARASRLACIALGAVVQLGILATMRIGMFTELMLAVLTLWIPSDLIDRVERWRGREPATRAPREMSLARHAVGAAFVLQFVFAVWDPFLGRRLPLPRAIQSERLAASVTMGYSLFDITYAIPHWEGPGRLESGEEVDVFATVAPGIRARGPGTRHSRWNKITFKSLERPLAMDEFAAYVCRAYDARARGSSRLATFTIVNWATPPRSPRSGAGLERREELLRHTCDGVAAPPTDGDDAIARRAN